MARNRNKVRLDPPVDATEQRLTRAIEESGNSGEAWEYINPAKIDSCQPIGLVRRFRSSHLDRFYRRDSDKSILTWRQYYAGDWYRNTYNRAGITISVIASYGERVSGGEPAYGLPRTQRQADARRLWRDARGQFSLNMVGFLDRLLLHDELPRYGGRQRSLRLDRLREELDKLADWLKIAREPKAA